MHLNRPEAGMLPWKGLFFKFEDGAEFKESGVLIPEMQCIGHSVNFVVFKEGSGTPYFLTNLSDLATHFGWNRQELYHHRERVGKNVPFKGYLIRDIESFDNSSLLDK